MSELLQRWNEERRIQQLEKTKEPEIDLLLLLLLFKFIRAREYRLLACESERASCCAGLSILGEGLKQILEEKTKKGTHSAKRRFFVVARLVAAVSIFVLACLAFRSRTHHSKSEIELLRAAPSHSAPR